MEKKTQIPVIHRIFCSSLLDLKISSKWVVSRVSVLAVVTMTGIIQIWAQK
jgi:hypothetical protein